MDEEKKTSGGMTGKKKADFLTLAVKRLKRSIDKDDHNRKAAIEDLEFLNGNQWDEGEKKRRKLRSRPCLTLNLLPKFVDQIVGDMRQNRPKIKIRPIDSKADPAIAKIREGIIWNIEYLSGAEAIHDDAGESTTACGYGAWRVLTRYTEENPFTQEIYLDPIENPFNVHMDPAAKHFMYSDANYAFILDEMPVDEFKETYPGKELPGDSLEKGSGTDYEDWWDDETVRVAEYYVREKKKIAMAQMDNGDVITLDEANKRITEWQEKNMTPVLSPATGMPGEMGGMPEGLTPLPPANPSPMMEQEPQIVKTRDTDKIKVKHYVITASEILKEEECPGEFIPIILLRGRIRNIGGKTYVRGLIRDAKDPQRLVDYWNTAAAEAIALAPKTPWIGTAKQFQGYENDYAMANIENFPFLKYNIDQGAPPPTRVPFGDPPVAMFAQISRAEENLKSVVGMFNRDVGDQGPEMSGVAITKAQTPGDVATFAFIDNLARAIEHEGRIINSMIPEVYDTERDVRLRNVDDTETFAPINTTAANALENITTNPTRYQGLDKKKLMKSIQEKGDQAIFNDIAAGKYDVVVDVGPSYTTQRQESAQAMMDLVKADPQRLMGIAGDLIVRNLDFKDADTLATRLEKTLPAGLKELKEGEEPPPPAPPDPNVLISQAMVQVEELKVKTAEQKLIFDTQIQEQKLAIEKLKVMKEGLSDKNAIRKEILSVLQEVNAPTHPADALMGQRSIEARADGGPVGKGRPYLVGENGPELIIPDESGVVIPNALPNDQVDRSNWPLRQDGTPKGYGWLGVIPNGHGGVSTELTAGVNIDGKEMIIPTMVPGLTASELNHLLTAPEDPTMFQHPLGKSALNKAVEHAKGRIKAGKSPFKD